MQDLWHTTAEEHLPHLPPSPLANGAYHNALEKQWREWQDKDNPCVCCYVVVPPPYYYERVYYFPKPLL